MGWWQGAFKRSSDDDNDDRTSWYSLKPRFFSSRRNRNARKIRHVARNQVDVWRSSSHSELSRDTALPLPLPLPDLHVLLRDDPRSASTHSVPLPSPDTAQNLKKGCDDKERERDGERQTTEAVLNTDAIDVPNGLNRLIGQDTSMENVEKSTKKQTSKGISYRINIPTSAPASPYTSPVLSPPNSDHMLATQNYTNPPSSVYRVWSEPDMAPCDGNIGLGLYKRMPSDRIYSSVDSSPIESPGTSSVYAASPPMPASPNPSPTPVALPLPLPPGAAMPPQPTSTSPILSSKSEIPVQPSSSIPQVAAKIELMPVKSQWSKGKLIGRGTFGSVYVASNRETGALCAMKEVEILPDDSKSAECIRQLEQEIKVLSNRKHPNIVQYYGSEIIGDKFYIYLEYVHPGSINKFINDHCGAITESVVRNFTRHILSGLSYLHNTKTIHRDIKGANLLVDANGVVKLADFGMAKHLNGQTANLSLKGSPYWLAPELLQCVMQNDGSGDAALAVDIWSLGCTIIEMMNGKPPWSEYEGAAALFKVLQETPAIPETMSADGKDFLKCCFRRNPAERPTANELLDHPFVNYSQQDNIQIPRPAAAATLSL